MFAKCDPRSIIKRDTSANLNIAMNPESWKVVTKSPAALKSKIYFLILI